MWKRRKKKCGRKFLSDFPLFIPHQEQEEENKNVDMLVYNTIFCVLLSLYVAFSKYTCESTKKKKKEMMMKTMLLCEHIHISARHIRPSRIDRIEMGIVGWRNGEINEKNIIHRCVFFLEEIPWIFVYSYVKCRYKRLRCLKFLF